MIRSYNKYNTSAIRERYFGELEGSQILTNQTLESTRNLWTLPKITFLFYLTMISWNCKLVKRVHIKIFKGEATWGGARCVIEMGPVKRPMLFTDQPINTENDVITHPAFRCFWKMIDQQSCHHITLNHDTAIKFHKKLEVYYL